MELTPFYVLKLLGTYVGLLLAAFSAWKYKDELHEILFKDKYQYRRTKEIEVGEYYELQIAIIGEEMEIA